MKKVVLILGLVICYFSSYSQEVGSFTDPRDGKVYKTVKIGEQWVMAENFSYKPGDFGYWAYENDSQNVTKYGYLYDWETAKSIAPAGWHLPTKEEWTTFYEFLGGKEKAFSTMREGGSSGFNTTFGGWYAPKGKFYPDGELGLFWSSTPEDSEHAWAMFCESSSGQAKLRCGVRSFAYSVRLFADNADDVEDNSIVATNPENSLINDSLRLKKARTLTTVYSRTYFQIRFMNVTSMVFEVITPILDGVSYELGGVNSPHIQNSYPDNQKGLYEVKGDSARNQRINSNEFEKKLGDFDVLSYFASSFYNSRDSINNFNIVLTLDKSEHSKIIDRLLQKTKKLDPAFTNELNNSNNKYISAFKFQYGIGARAGGEQFGMVKEYRPFVRLVGYVKDVNSNIIVWANTIIVFSNTVYHGRDVAKSADEKELIKEFKKISNKLVKITISDLNGQRYSSTEQLVDIAISDNFLK